MNKILLIDDNFHSKKKGAPLFNMEVDYLSKKGYEVFVLGFDTSTDLAKGNYIIIKENKNKVLFKTSKFIGNPIIQKQVSQVIQIIQPNIIHCHLLSNHALNVLRAIPEGIPVIQTLHGPNFFCPTSWGCIKKDSSPCSLGVTPKCYKENCVSKEVYYSYKILDSKLKSLLHKKVSVFHCPSKQIEEVANNHGFHNTQHISLGIRSVFTEDNFDHDSYGSKQVTFIGSLHPVKGVDYLIRAFQEVVSEVPEAKLNIVGHGLHLNNYKNLVQKLQLEDNINFKGFLNQSQLFEVFKISDLCVMPSIWSEQFGMVGPEALSCGVPVIASNIGGIPEWLNSDKLGWLVKPRNERELKDKIVFGLKNPQLLKRMGNYAKAEMREKYRAEKYLSKLEKLIKTTSV